MRNRVFTVTSLALAGLGFYADVANKELSRVDVFGYVWNIWLVAAGASVVLGLLLANRDKAKQLNARPKIKIDTPLVETSNPSSNNDTMWMHAEARVSVRNASDLGGSSATRMRAWAMFTPVGETAEKYEAASASGLKYIMPLRVDCPWTVRADPAGFVELNPSDERQLYLAWKDLFEPFAYACDAHRTGRDGLELFEGEYTVVVTVTGSNFPPASQTFQFTNDGTSKGIELALVQSRP